MFEIVGNRPRLVVVGPETDPTNESIMATLAHGFETCIVGQAYPTWSAAYAGTHRACSYLEYGGLFTAVTDLMGEVPFCGVVSLDERADPTLRRVCATLGLIDTCGDAVPGPAGLSGSVVVEDRGDGVRVYRDGADEPLLNGLSAVLRSGLLDQVAAPDVAALAAAAFDVPSRNLMRWLDVPAMS